MDSVRIAYFSGQLLDCIHHIDKAAEKLLALQERELGPVEQEMLTVFSTHKSELLAAAENLQRVVTAVSEPK